MLTLLAKIIPLDIAAVLSPGIFAITVLLLGSKFGIIANSGAFVNL